MKRQVLIVGEKRDFVEWVRQELEKESEFVAISAASSDAGLELALQLKPHLILVDTTLHGSEGFAFCRRLHRDWETRDIPLLLLLDATAAEGQALILKFRAEDYLRKPVVPHELVSKTRALIRHRQIDSAENKGFDDGWLFIDFEAYAVRVNGRELKMTLKEFSLLKFLAQNQGRVFSRDQLLRVIWEYHEFRESRTVDVHVRRIRMKLGPEAEGYIQTIVGAGYLFKAQSKAVESTSLTELGSNPKSIRPQG